MIMQVLQLHEYADADVMRFVPDRLTRCSYLIYILEMIVGSQTVMLSVHLIGFLPDRICRY